MEFLSTAREYRMCVVPPTVTVNAYGQRTPVSGKWIQFDNNKYKTNDKNEIRWLLEHKYYGADFFAIDKNGKLDREAELEKLDKADEAKTTAKK